MWLCDVFGAKFLRQGRLKGNLLGLEHFCVYSEIPHPLCKSKHRAWDSSFTFPIPVGMLNSRNVTHI